MRMVLKRLANFPKKVEVGTVVPALLVGWAVLVK